MDKLWLRGMTMVAAAILGSVLGMATDAPPAPALPAGTTLHIRLGATLTDKTNQVGDTFTGQISQPVVVNGQEVLPKFSTVDGHVAYIKPSGRVKGQAQMRIVLDKITTPEGVAYPLSAMLEDAHGADCSNMKQSRTIKGDEEGTITGCGKSKKQALKEAGIMAGVGTAAGAMAGMQQDCYFCMPGAGPNMGTDIMYGAAAGGATALLFNLLKHEKHIVLVEGTVLTFVVSRTTNGQPLPPGSQPQDQ